MPRDERFAVRAVIVLVVALWLTVMAGLVRGMNDHTPYTPNLASTVATTSTSPTTFSGGGAAIREDAGSTPVVDRPAESTSYTSIGSSKAKPVYPTDELLHDLAMCESTMDQQAYNAAGPYLSFFQWHQATWEGIGGTGDPRNASYETQRDFARALILAPGKGWRHFPRCSRIVGAR